MSYTCSECGRPIGAILGANGQPELFKCPRTGRIADPIIPIRRKPPVRREPKEQPVRRRPTEEAA